MIDQLSQITANVAMAAASTSQALIGGDIGAPINIAFGLVAQMLTSMVVIAVVVAVPFAILAGGHRAITGRRA